MKDLKGKYSDLCIVCMDANIVFTTVKESMLRHSQRTDGSASSFIHAFVTYLYPKCLLLLFPLHASGLSF